MTGMPPIAVLAGGLATRMRPLTEQLPKALLKVGGEPFVAHQLRLFAREGITDVKLLVGHCWEQIALFVGNGKRFGVKVDYIVDGPTPLGTGGAVRQAIDCLGPEFLVTYCDSWLDAPYAPVVEAFHASGRLALMCVFRNENRWDASNVHFENGVIRCYSKKFRPAGNAPYRLGARYAKNERSRDSADGKALGSGRTLRRVVDFRPPGGL